jgi:hypothetical protein
VLIKGTTDFLDHRQLWYTRDETTGFIRAQAQIDGRELDNTLLITTE